MSTSTISSALSHFYYCLSNFKSPHFDGLTYSYDAEPLKYMLSQRKPNTVFMRMVDARRGVYSIDNDSGFIEPSNMAKVIMPYTNPTPVGRIYTRRGERLVVP